MSIEISDMTWSISKIDMRHGDILEATWDMGALVTWDNAIL